MKSYLSLVPISAKVRKRQNRMTILCVIISIFLVTAIFSVADMMIRTQSDRMTGKNGSWHIELDGISQETALKIAERDDVVSIGAVTIFNPDGELPYRMDGKRVVLYGIDESYLTMNSTGAAEGRFPQGMGEIMLSSNAARVLQVAVGDTVTLRTPSGDWDFTVSGLGGVEESYYSGQYSLMDAYLPRTAFAALMEQNNVHNLQTSYYVQFTSASKAAKAIPELTAQHNLPENAVSENTGVMAIAGHSDSSAAKNVYSLAAVLFVLVLLAGVSHINREKIDAIREAVKELEKAGYIVRSRERDEKGRLRGADYVIYEQPQPREPEAATSGGQPPILDLPTLENPTLLFLLAYMGTTGNQPPLCTLLACLLILLYNGKRGKLKLKYFFYVFYPAHILVLYLIQIGLGKYLLK